MNDKLKSLHLQKLFPYLLLITAVIGLLASFVLTVDKIHVLRDSSYQPPCNINPLFSCGSVMKTPQADINGIPNTIFGVIGFTAAVTVAASLFFGAKMNRRFWQLFNLGMLLGVAAVMYLFYQALYVINTLCIYCMAVWVVVIMMLYYVTLWNIENGHVILPKRLESCVAFVRKYHLEVLVSIYLLLTTLIVVRFWYYFSTLL
jgi:uncharacterized membrane protein